MVLCQLLLRSSLLHFPSIVMLFHCLVSVEYNISSHLWSHLNVGAKLKVDGWEGRGRIKYGEPHSNKS